MKYTIAAALAVVAALAEFTVVPYLQMDLEGTVRIDGLYDLQAALASIAGGGTAYDALTNCIGSSRS